MPGSATSTTHLVEKLRERVGGLALEVEELEDRGAASAASSRGFSELGSISSSFWRISSSSWTTVEHQ